MPDTWTIRVVRYYLPDAFHLFQNQPGKSADFSCFIVDAIGRPKILARQHAPVVAPEQEFFPFKP